MWILLASRQTEMKLGTSTGYDGSGVGATSSMM